MNCPKCQGDDWIAASLAHAQGLSSVNTSTSGSTLGIGAGTGGVGIGYGRSSSSTSGAHQTVFSKSASPPKVLPKPGPKSKENVPLGIVDFVFRGKLKAKANSFARETYKLYEEQYAKQNEAYEASVAAYVKWERTRICLRCGTHYAPEKD